GDGMHAHDDVLVLDGAEVRVGAGAGRGPRQAALVHRGQPEQVAVAGAALRASVGGQQGKGVAAVVGQGAELRAARAGDGAGGDAAGAVGGVGVGLDEVGAAGDQGGVGVGAVLGVVDQVAAAGVLAEDAVDEGEGGGGGAAGLRVAERQVVHRTAHINGV